MPKVLVPAPPDVVDAVKMAIFNKDRLPRGVVIKSTPPYYFVADDGDQTDPPAPETTKVVKDSPPITNDDTGGERE